LIVALSKAASALTMAPFLPSPCFARRNFLNTYMLQFFDIMPKNKSCVSSPNMAFRHLVLLIGYVLICFQDLVIAHPLEHASLHYPTSTPKELAVRVVDHIAITVQLPPSTAVQTTVPGTKGVRSRTVLVIPSVAQHVHYCQFVPLSPDLDHQYNPRNRGTTSSSAIPHIICGFSNITSFVFAKSVRDDRQLQRFSGIYYAGTRVNNVISIIIYQ